MSQVVGLWHVGVTVRSMPAALRFYVDGLGLPLEARVERRPPFGATATPAETLEIVMLRIPGSDVRIELLEFGGLERHSGASRLVDLGAGHVCLRVEDRDARRARATEMGGRLSGNHGEAVLDPDGYRVELARGPAGFGHAGITVRDIDRALRFYRDVLGLAVLAAPSEGQVDLGSDRDRGVPSARTVRLLAPGPAAVELSEYTGVERYPASCRPCDYGAGHLCLYVDDLQSTYDRVLGAGYLTRAPIANSPRGRVVYAIDEDGHHVELFERRVGGGF
jgi:lactoylglutathione lyase